MTARQPCAEIRDSISERERDVAVCSAPGVGDTANHNVKQRSDVDGASATSLSALGANAVMKLCTRLQQERPWSDLSVGDQLHGILLRTVMREAQGQSPSRFNDLVIPWGGLAGVTLFARVDSKAHRWIEAKETTGAFKDIKLPLYEDQMARVHLDLSPPNIA